MVVMTLARWLARKAVKAEWKASGRNPQYAEASEIAAASNVYFMEHRNELLEEAREHPVAKEYRHKERMRLARKAVIAEIRERGGKVKSIEPSEIRKLVRAYLEEHPEEGVIREMVCF
jgi:hypothetical protein